MEPIVLITYLSGALAYAVGLTALLWGAGRVLGQPMQMRFLGLSLAGFFVVFLGLHPFPALADVECVAPRLSPLQVIEPARRLWHAGAPPEAWLSNRGVVAPLMNVMLFMWPGMALAAAMPMDRVGAHHAAAAGLGLSFFIETAQLTGLFGFYPCPYRHFETADLILNTLGVTLGFVLVRMVQRKRNFA